MTRITKDELEKAMAIDWLKENEHKTFLGHGMSDRHEALVLRMKEVAER
jgi:hypothetical protein